jgi:phosphoribosylaminoimidazolecarboxamide formyltransferase/IMP cyclohydrolase
VSLIRSAAKNFNDVLIVSAKNQYQKVVEHLSENYGNSTLEFRKSFAIAAFAQTSNYDSLIFNHFNQVENQSYLRLTENTEYPLRYGENPHQHGAFWGNFDEMFEKLNGKPLSYNNLLDVDAAVNMIEDFDECTFIIIKHNNTYLSAYAHNKQLLVKEGDQVAPGQQIAEMGSNQHQDSVLHFEIRRNGKSVDPTEYLPQR